MITPSECREFKGKRVAVATDNFQTGGWFAYYGYLLEVTDKFVKIKMDIGYKQIPLVEIIEIKIARRYN